MKKVLLIMVVIALANCATATKGSRIDETLVNQIKIGKTTRGDILKMFGAPDRIIDAGGVVTSKTAVTGDVRVMAKEEIKVDKNQEIYIYEYIENKEVTYWYLANTRKEKKNTLMIWIDKDTGIVQDCGYKKEI